MTRVYYYKIDKTLDLRQRDDLLALLSREERQRADAFRFKKDFHLYVVGKIMTRKVLAAELDILPQDIKFRIDKYKRPYLDLLQEVYLDFNISHSGEYVVLAVSEKSVGIDIERIKSIDLNLATDVFHQEELAYLFQKKEGELERFFRLWTLKESFIKAVGEGLSFPLKEFYFNFSSNEIELNILREGTSGNWFFQEFSVDDDYKLAFCICADDKVNSPIVFKGI